MALKITLDPGHGQYGNKSPNNTKYIEGTQMWHLANKLKVALEAYGFEVVTTRPKISDDPSLNTRGKTAADNGSCLFLSLHSNAPGKSADGTYSKTVTGTVVYYSMTRAENKDLADKLGNKVSELMGHHFRGSKTKEYPNKPGVDYYGVIRAAAQNGCKCAMLIEHGFHTNVADSNYLLVDANLQALAEAEAAIIADYFGQKKANTPTTTEKPSATTNTTLYRVQTGAFSVKKYADAHLNKIKAAGFEAYMVKADNLFKIQVGAFSKKENAQAMLKKVTAAGFSAYITTSTGSAVAAETSAKKSVDELAKEVINGKWGNGTARKQALTAAGYDYATVQKRVNELLSK